MTVPAVQDTEPPSPPVRGRLILLDALNREAAYTEASFELWYEEGRGGWNRLEVDVVEGRWEAAIPSSTGFNLSELLVDGEIAYRVDGSGRPARWGRLDAVPDPLFVELVQPTTLHVVDVETGRELEDVRLLHPTVHSRRLYGEGDLGRAQPDMYPVVEATRDSPIELRPQVGFVVGSNEGLELLYARSPGYTWGSLQLDHVRGGDRILELRRAATVVVTAVGASAVDADPWVRFYEEGRPRVFLEERLDDGLTATLDVVPPGAYRITVERGRYDGAVVLGEAFARIESGDHLELDVRVEERPPAAERSVEGTLFVPAAWGDEPVTMTFMALESSQREELKDVVPGTVAAWRIESTTSRRWRFRVEPMSYTLTAELEPGANRVDIAVPPPLDFTIRPVDEEGRSVSLDRVIWSLESEFPWRFGSASGTAVPGFEVRILPGDEFLVHVQGDYVQETELELPANGGSVRLPVFRARGVELVLKGDDWLAGERAEGWLRIVGGPDGGRVVSHGKYRDRERVFFSRAGAYELELRPGESSPPRIVHVVVPESGFGEPVVVSGGTGF